VSSALDHDGGPPGDAVPNGLLPIAGLDRLQVLLSAAMGTVLVSYALLVPPTAFVMATGGDGVSVDAAFAATVPVWLAAHQIPLSIGGQPLSVLPLLPTALVVAVVAVGAGWAVRRIGGRFRADAGAVLASIAGAHAAVAVLGSALLPRSAAVDAAPWAAMVGGGLVAAAGAVLGVLRRCELPADLRAMIPVWVRPGLHAALRALLVLLLAGAVVLTAALVFGAPAVAAAYDALAPGFWPGAGVTLVALAYLPNAVVAGTAWVLGPGFAVGTGTVSVFASFPPAAQSSFPLMALLPAGPPPVWTLAVLLVPIGAGVLAGRVCRELQIATARVPAAAVAITVTTLVIGLFCLLAGGRLAAGAFDPVSVPPGLAMASVLLLVGVPAMLVAGVARRGEPDEAEWTEDAPVPAAPEPAEAEPPRPRTVAELVALRERQAAAAAAEVSAEVSAADEGAGAEPADGAGAVVEEGAEPIEIEGSVAEPLVEAVPEPRPEPDEEIVPGAGVEPPAAGGADEAGDNVVPFDRRRRRS